MIELSITENTIKELETPVLTLPFISSDNIQIYTVRGTYGDIYEIDLKNFSCSCLNWIEERVRFPHPDIRRACKHIRQAISNDLFVVKGSKLASKLIPIPPCNYRLAAFEIDNSVIIFRQAEDRRWFDIVAPTLLDQDVYDVFGTDASRWSENIRPKHSKVIKKIIKSWLKSQPQQFGEKLPLLPKSALEAINKRIAEEEVNRQRCYVCGFQLSFPNALPETIKLSCPRCNTVNILTQSGRTNTPERMNLYRKYDGDLYKKSVEALFAKTIKQFDADLEMLNQFKVAGKIADEEYENIYKEHNRQKQSALQKLQQQKESELDKIRKQEKEIQKKFCKN